MNALEEWLLRRAAHFWNRGQRLPLDLFAQLLGAGLDVEALEAQYMKDPA